MKRMAATVDGENEILNPTVNVPCSSRGLAGFASVVAAYHNKLAQGLADLLRANSKEIMSVLYYHLRLKGDRRRD
jgi:hypothetical protein